jgi:hypothetical protein
MIKLFHKLLEPIRRRPSILIVLATHEELHLNPLTIQPPYMHCSMVSFHYLTRHMCASLNYKLLNTCMLYDSPYLAWIQIQHKLILEPKKSLQILKGLDLNLLSPPPTLDCSSLPIRGPSLKINKENFQQKHTCMHCQLFQIVYTTRGSHIKLLLVTHLRKHGMTLIHCLKYKTL